MAENQEKINLLLDKLDILLKKQESFTKEITELQSELNTLNISRPITNTTSTTATSTIRQETVAPRTQMRQRATKVKKPPRVRTTPKMNIDVEKFIGENLINKIGIAITVIGVAIGAKYSIEHELISPLTRIILGYLAGLGLLGVGIKLKKNYENYSAVLVSGAIAIMYFITYAAYSFYSLIPTAFTFTLMTIFTAFSVIAAINYGKQVIAHIGLVGAYAVPFLLSEGSNNVTFLFSYMAIVNIGILVVSLYKYWKPLYYSSFVITWLIFFAWNIEEYNPTENFALAAIFLCLFYVIFYLTFLAYKFIKQEKFNISDIMLFLSNSFLFFGIGYWILSNHETGKQLLGLFTLLNAIIHFIVSTVLYKKQLADKNLLQLTIGLVMVFITIAIPIQLEGNWVTLLWVGEAAILFWIGRTKNVGIYELLSYPLILLAFFSIIQDWSLVYNSYYPEYPESRIIPILNIHFLTSILFIGSLIFINIINTSKKFSYPIINRQRLLKTISIALPIILLITIYFSFRLELANFYHQLHADSTLMTYSNGETFSNYGGNTDLLKFKSIWVINYSLLFFTLLTFLNIKKIKNQIAGIVLLGLTTITLVVFLTQGLYVLSELRESYITLSLSEYYQQSSFNLVIRYISFVFISFALFVFHMQVKQQFLKVNFKIAFDFILHTSILWILSSELINWIDISESTETYKLGLSILWGLYALLIIILGIWKKKKHLRIGAISLFGVTLIKLFFYDISHLNTISKTIVFVSLGILLLLVSFLYNKYKHIISNDE